MDHFFLTSTHNWLLFFTNKGRVYRCKAYELPEGSRDSKGQHVANLLQFAPDDTTKALLAVPHEGFSKRSAMSEFRLQGRNGFGVKAVLLVVGRVFIVGALVVSEEDQVMAIMTSGPVIRAKVNEVKLTGLTTQGVTYAKPENNDEIISIARNAEAEDEADGETTTTESSGSASSIQPAQGEPLFEVSTEEPSNYEVAKYLVLATRSGKVKKTRLSEYDLVLATRSGKVKKTRLSEYDSPRQGGLIAVRLMTEENGETADELIVANLCNAEDVIILVSKHGMSLKFRADDDLRRPMGRQTAGVQGM